MAAGEVVLLRRISWPMLALYGLGSTIGAGIYVIIGAVAARAGYYAPLVFVITSLVALFSAASFAELAVRYPVSSGEAAYVRAGFGSAWLALVVGVAVAVSGVISSAALLQGGAGYLRELFNLPPVLAFFLLLVALGGLAVWGIAESVFVAAVFTIVEISGLGFIILFAPADPVSMLRTVIAAAPAFDFAVVAGISGSVLLVFYAYIGFEDMVNVVEEVRRPERDIPLAFAATFLVSTLLYIWITLIAITAVPLPEIAHSPAPLALVFGAVGGSGVALSYIAVAAVLNGVVIQIVMASRVLYGLSRLGQLPVWLGVVSRKTHTPVNATVLVCGGIAILGSFFSVVDLAKMTSSVMLFVFALVNLSLAVLKWRGGLDVQGFQVPIAVPILGFITCVVCLLGEVVQSL